jgi:hypothetical protein
MTYFLSIPGGIGVEILFPLPLASPKAVDRSINLLCSVSVSFPPNPTNLFSSSSASLYSIALLALVLAAPYPYAVDPPAPIPWLGPTSSA